MDVQNSNTSIPTPGPILTNATSPIVEKENKNPESDAPGIDSGIITIGNVVPLKRTADDISEDSGAVTAVVDQDVAAIAPAADAKVVITENKEMERKVKPKTMQMSLKFPVKITPEQEKYLALEVKYISPDWYDALLMELKAPYFINIKKKLEQEKAAGHKIYPAEDEIYTFTRCPLNDVRVVILGQDPYHGPGQAHGLCFSVKKGVPSPPSLVNIFKELKNEYGDAFETPKHGDLSGWCEQGVLLLNATLTVRAHNANSHSTWGWTTFTDKIISYINSHHENVVFILWGAYAQKKGQLVDKKKHLVLAGPHPSPLSAHRGFFGCKHFSKANDYLEQKGKTAVNWNSLP